MNNIKFFVNAGFKLIPTSFFGCVVYPGDHDGYDDSDVLERLIEQMQATGVAALCGNGVIAVECVSRGFDSRSRFMKLVEINGGTVSPFAVVDNYGGNVWYLYRCDGVKKSYLAPFTGWVNIIGKGKVVPLPGDKDGRFTWLGDAPTSLNQLPNAMSWFFPGY